MYNDGVTPIPSVAFLPDNRNFSDIYLPFNLPSSTSGTTYLAKEVILHIIDISKTPLTFVVTNLSTYYAPYNKPKPYWFITNTPTPSLDTPEPAIDITTSTSSKNLINLNTLWNQSTSQSTIQNIQYIDTNPKGSQYGQYTLPTTISGKLVLSPGNTYCIKIPGTYTNVINRPLVLDRRYAIGIAFIVSSITPYPFTFPLTASNPIGSGDTINSAYYYTAFTWSSFINNTSDYNIIFETLQIPLSPIINGNIEYTPLAIGNAP